MSKECRKIADSRLIESVQLQPLVALAQPLASLIVHDPGSPLGVHKAQRSLSCKIPDPVVRLSVPVVIRSLAFACISSTDAEASSCTS
jgi:hypothetical protein